MHCNCTRTDFEVRPCTMSLPHIRKKNSFHNLISVIRIFMRKFFMVQCHPRNIFNIELFLDYGNFDYPYHQKYGNPIAHTRTTTRGNLIKTQQNNGVQCTCTQKTIYDYNICGRSKKREPSVV